MPSDIIARYQSTYRKDEINLVIRLAKRGESLGFVGVAGVGKSNIVNFLRDIQKNAPHVKPDVTNLHFPVVDATQWQGTAENLWTLMLDALRQTTAALSAPEVDNKILPFAEDERVLNALRQRLKWLCQEAVQQIMFILDDFDRVIETGQLAMLETLNALRSEGNRGMLSYLVITKRLPHILGQGHDLKRQSKFYDLFRPNIFALEPYTRDDAMRMLIHLNEKNDRPLTDKQLDQVYQLGGGHARLQWLVFHIWANEGVIGLKSNYFAAKPDILHECQRILENLHEHEQEVAIRVAQQKHSDEDRAVIDHLARRGLLLKTSESPTWFSPLWGQFLKSYEDNGGV